MNSTKRFTNIKFDPFTPGDTDKAFKPFEGAPDIKIEDIKTAVQLLDGSPELQEFLKTGRMPADEWFGELDLMLDKKKNPH